MATDPMAQRPGPAARRRVLTTAVTAAIVAVAMLVVGCTPGRSGADAAGSTAASARGSTAAGATGTGSAVPAGTGSRPASGGGTTGAGTAATGTHAGGTDATETAAGQPLLTTVIGTQTVTIQPEATDPLGPATTQRTPTAEQAALNALLPGLYGWEDLNPAPHGSSVDISATASCAFVMDVLGSGQWRLAPVTKPHGGSATTVAVLSRGDTEALVTVTESPNLCAGTITSPHDEPITVSGMVRASGSARAVTVGCVAQVNADEDTPSAFTVATSYRTPSAAFLVISTVPTTKGTQQISGDDGPTIMIVLDPRRSVVTQAATVWQAFVDPTSQAAGGLPAGMNPQSLWEADAATATITSTNPLAGSISATGMARQTGGGSVSVRAAFACDPDPAG